MTINAEPRRSVEIMKFQFSGVESKMELSHRENGNSTGASGVLSLVQACDAYANIVGTKFSVRCHARCEKHQCSRFFARCLFRES